jgi:hypothetical protein
MSKGLSTEQAVTALEVKRRMKAQKAETPLALPRAELVSAHREGYPQLAGADSRTVAAYVNRNLRSPNFWAALGFNSNEIKRFLGEEVMRNLRGENELFPKDKNIYLDSLKIAARLAFEEKTRVTVDVEMKDRSDEDLEFYIRNGRWPGSTDDPRPK